MPFDPLRDRPGRPSGRPPGLALLSRRGIRLALCFAGVTLLPGAAPAPAEERVQVKGLFDAEVWKTDDGSALLEKNEGNAATARRLTLSAAGEFNPRLQGFFQGEWAGGNTEEEGTYAMVQQAFLRYSFKAPLRLRIEAGQFTAPLGSFSRRYLSYQNPLIGAPDTYDVSYPLGFQVAGSAGRFDYHAAVIDRPMVNEKYVPEPGKTARPAVAAGITPVTGLRFGVFATWGPYLSEDLRPMLPPGADWKGYRQELFGFDMQFSRGYFELNNEFNVSRYDVPYASQGAYGKSFYIEPKYTWTPRLFTALRLERNDYPYIKPLGPGVWLGNVVGFYDVEIGVGYRLSAGLLLKAAYRRDHWNVEDYQKAYLPNGYSAALQLSYSFDVNSWVERPR